MKHQVFLLLLFKFLSLAMPYVLQTMKITTGRRVKMRERYTAVENFTCKQLNDLVALSGHISRSLNATAIDEIIVTEDVEMFSAVFWSLKPIVEILDRFASRYKATRNLLEIPCGISDIDVEKRLLCHQDNMPLGCLICVLLEPHNNEMCGWLYHGYVEAQLYLNSLTIGLSSDIDPAESTISVTTSDAETGITGTFPSTTSANSTHTFPPNVTGTQQANFFPSIRLVAITDCTKSQQLPEDQAVTRLNNLNTTLFRYKSDVDTGLTFTEDATRVLKALERLWDPDASKRFRRSVTAEAEHLFRSRRHEHCQVNMNDDMIALLDRFEAELYAWTKNISRKDSLFEATCSLSRMSLVTTTRASFDGLGRRDTDAAVSTNLRNVRAECFVVESSLYEKKGKLGKVLESISTALQNIAIVDEVRVCL